MITRIDGVRYANYCQHCIRAVQPLMLTTYALLELRCDRCQTFAELATVRLDPVCG